MTSYMTVPEAARFMRCSADTVYRRVRSGAIKGVRHGVGRAPYLVDGDSVRRFMAPDSAAPADLALEVKRLRDAIAAVVREEHKATPGIVALHIIHGEVPNEPR